MRNLSLELNSCPIFFSNTVIRFSYCSWWTQLTELANTDFESWAKESYEIATKIAYRNGGRIGIPRDGSLDCTMVAAVPVLPVGYVVRASRIADRRMILVGYRLADLLTRVPKL
jgi:hypothetical protein